MEKKREVINKMAFLREAINDDKLVVFAGSGVSVESGLPLWKDLLNGIKLKLNFDAKDENDALKISQLLFNEKGEKEYYDIIKEIINRKSNNRYNVIHNLIYDLNPQHIVTTNYDNFFEQIIENEGLPFSIVVKDEDLPYAKHKNLLIKYHGDFENHNIVLKETDYLEFSKNHTLKEIFVKSLFSNKVILFIGYSFSDINLKLLNREMQYLLKKHHQRSYILNSSKDLSTSEKTYYENMGINIINYYEAKNEIENLDHYCADEKLNLNSHSAKVYSLLNYLKCFDLDKHKSSIGNLKDQIIDEFYHSLKRFYYFRVLPEQFIANFFPLNKNYAGTKNDFSLQDTTLMCFNDNLLDIIDAYQGVEDENFSIEQSEKLQYCISRLTWSDVKFLTKAIYHPNYQNSFKGDEKNKISLVEKVKTADVCDCINCTIRGYNYSKAFKHIDEYIITESSDLSDDLAYAFACLSLHKNYKSFYAFKQLFIKANKLKKYEISFLSKYNMCRIGKKSGYLYMQDVAEDDIEIIKNEIENIDLDKELNKIRYFVDEKMYEFLREIKNGVYIQNLCNDVDENYSKIFKTKKLIKRGGSSSNNDIYNLYTAITKLEDFREYNFVYGNGFSRIEETLEKSISAFLTAYSMKLIDISNAPRLFGVPAMDQYDSYLLKIIVDYAKPAELLGFVRENELNNIQINDSVNKFAFDVSTLLECVTDNGYYDNLASRKFISQLILDNSFASSIKRKLENICIIIAHFEFSSYHLKNFIEKLNEFIKHVKFIKGFEYKYFDMVLVNKYDLIDADILLDTLKLFHDNKQYSHIFFLLMDTLKQKDKNFIVDYFNIDFLNFERSTNYIGLIYNCLNGKDKIMFKNKFYDFLNSEKARTVDLYVAIDNSDFVTEEIIDIYKVKINALLKEEKNNNNYNRNKEIQIFYFVELLYTGKINTIKIEKSKIKHEYYKFLIAPENYKKESFDPCWLKNYPKEIFYARFKKIPYIIKSLEDYLLINDDKELSNIYFTLRRNN